MLIVEKWIKFNLKHFSWNHLSQMDNSFLSIYYRSILVSLSEEEVIFDL